METTSFRTCPLCEATCGLAIRHDGERVLGIRGDADDVFSRGFICPKGAALEELHEDPDRLRAPQVKGADGSWTEVSWEEAFRRVAEGFGRVVAAHGPDALGAYLGNPNAHTLSGALYLRPLLKSLRTRHLYSASTVDQMPKHVSSGLLFGSPRHIPIPDLDRTDVLLMLGANPRASNGSLCTAPDFPGRLDALRARGGTLIVVDPRRSETAARADRHVPLQPGTDALFLAALIHAVVRDERVALGRLAPWIDGAERIEAVVAPFSPARVAPRCGIPEATIEEIARTFVEAERAVCYGRIGTTTQRFGTVASWLVDVLNALTGNLDEPGGALFPEPAESRVRSGGPGGRGFRLGRWRSRVRELPEVLGELPVATLADEILTGGPGQLRALLTVAGNPVLSTPDADRLDAALGALDFLVSVDPYRNETTRHADVILPPPSPLHRSHYDLGFYPLAIRNVANYSPPVFPLPDGQLPEWTILLRLQAIALGQPGATAEALDEALARTMLQKEVTAAGSPVEGRDADELLAALAPRVGPERLLDALLRTGPHGDAFGARPEGLTLAALEAAPHGIDLGPLAPRLPGYLATRDGRIALVPEALEGELSALQDELDREAEPLVLVGRRHLRSNNSWMHNLPLLVRGRPRCTLEIHPDDAARLGLRKGSEARVRSRVGEVTLPVEITDGIRPGVVSAPHGWGHGAEGARLGVAAAHAGANVNRLADGEALDGPSGNAVLNGIPVEVRPA